MNLYNISHSLLSIGLALFFMYAGIKKFIPRNRQVPADPKIAMMAEQKKKILLEAVQNERYKAPAAFTLVVKSLSGSAYLKFVGMIQILASILIILPVYRLIGLIVLLPVIVNIFMFHVLMDNRMSENIETGLFLALNVLLILYYRVRFTDFLIKNDDLIVTQIKVAS